MSKSVKIIGSYTSPFVRIVRLIAEELGMDYEMDLTTFYAKNTPEQEAHVQANNPLMKIPVLVTADESIFESRVIITHLLKRHKPVTDLRAGFPSGAEEDNILSTIYGIIDAGILRFIMGSQQPGVNMEEGYLARSLDRMHSGLRWLDERPDLGKSFGVTEAALICALDWFSKRSVINWSAYRNLAAVHEKFAERPSVVKTRIPEDV